MNSIEIDSVFGIWESFDWYLLSSKYSQESIFYCPNLKVSLLITKNFARRIKDNDFPSSIQKILKGKENNPIYPTIERPKAFHLAIGLTNNCTLGCLYCHAEADKNKIIDTRYIDHAIEYAFQNASKTPRKILTVSFAVGGEPTMGWSLFKSTINKIREREQRKYCNVNKVYLSMTTNCYYGKDKRKYISENFDTLTLSLDGPKEIHDIHRPTRNDTSSYEIVKESCEFFIKSTSVKVGIRSTVSSISVQKLSDIVQYFYELFGNRFSITFEPLIQIGRALKNNLQSPNEDDFTYNFWEAYQVGKKLGINVTSSGVNINRLITRYCGAMSIPSFTVCTDGTITACHRDQNGKDYNYGKIDIATNQVLIDSSKITKNVSLAETPEYCKKCFAKYHCAGDCPDIRRIDYSRCNFNRFIIFKQLEELLNNKIDKKNPILANKPS
ncbi:MAG: radical SAM protein [Bacteroidota bacterium]